jgi:hypothetical protein
MAADEIIMGELHNMVAAALTVALEGEELPGYTDTDEEGNEVVVPAKRLPPSAAILQAAAKFLKDNNITCAPSKDNAVGELEAKLAERNAKKSNRANKLDLAAASADMSDRMKFTQGLPN